MKVSRPVKEGKNGLMKERNGERGGGEEYEGQCDDFSSNGAEIPS
jgi:hypothetical protein